MPNSHLSRGARRLFQLIQNFTRRYRRPFFASQLWVAGHLKASIRSVKRWYAELLGSGFIAQKRRSQRSAEIIVLRSILAPQMAPQMAPRYKEDSGVSPTERKRPVPISAKTLPGEPLSPEWLAAFEEQERLADARFARAYARFGVQDIPRKPVTSQGAAVRERQGIK